jgi:hypothetical protein
MHQPEITIMVELTASLSEIDSLSLEGALMHIANFLPMIDKDKQSPVIICGFDWLGVEEKVILQTMITEDAALVFDFYKMMINRVQHVKEEMDSVVMKITTVADYKLATDFIYTYMHSVNNQNLFLDAKVGLTKLCQN